MLSRYKNCWLFAFSLLLLPLSAQPAAISANGTCQIGNCTSPGTLSQGQSTGPSTFSFVYTFSNTDMFEVSGGYYASGNGPNIEFGATAAYVGNSTNSPSHADMLSVDLLQDFSSTSSLDGVYNYGATLSQANVASGSYVTADLSFGGQSLGMVGPYYGIGSENVGSGAVLNGLGDQTLADFNYTFSIAAGSPVVPEPADLGLVALGLLGLIGLTLRRRKSGSFV